MRVSGQSVSSRSPPAHVARKMARKADRGDRPTGRAAGPGAQQGTYRQGCSARPGGAAVTPLPSAWIVPRQAQSGWSTRVGKAPRAEPRQAAQGAPAPGGSAHTVPGGGVSRRVPQSLPPPPLPGTRTACGDHLTLLFTCSLTCGSSPTHQEVPAQTGPPSPPNPRAGFPLSQPEPSSPCFCLLVELPKTMEGTPSVEFRIIKLPYHSHN